MLLTSFLYALLATATLGLPTAKEQLAARVARRANETLHPNATFAQLSSANWAGVIIDASPQTWQVVYGVVDVPTPRVPSNGQSSAAYAGSLWVGMDRDSCVSAFFQIGIDYYVINGDLVYYGWYQWYPDSRQTITQVSFSPGDSVALLIYAQSATHVFATLDNISNGQSAGLELTSQNALCRQDGEWIVQSLGDGTGTVPLADFGTITFSGAVMETVNDVQFGPISGRVVNTPNSLLGYDDNSVTVTYL